MEALKIVLVVMLCLFVTIIVSLALRTEPCTHTCEQVCTHDSTLDPGPDLVTMTQFSVYCAATRKFRDVTTLCIDAQVKNNEVSLVAIKTMGKSIIENRESILIQQGQIQTMADGMVKMAEIVKRLVETK